MGFPTGPGRLAVAVAAAMWVGALGGPFISLGSAIAIVAVAGLVVAGVRSRAALLVLVAAIGLVSGALAAGREDKVLESAIPEGPGAVAATAATDTLGSGNRYQLVVRPAEWSSQGEGALPWAGPPIVVSTDQTQIVAGDVLIVHGVLRPDPGYYRGIAVAGRMSAQHVEIVSTAGQPLIAAGNLLRARVQTRVSTLGDSPAAALLSGFLIGDIADLPDDDEESLRRSGLTHYVAVSGSNVALVLGAWWLVVGPLGAGTRVRAATGLLVLIVFVVATRWESSVIRAATMAALVLGGRAVGVPLDAWTSLGAAVTILLAVSGDLAFDVGFQLSVLATGGVLVGMRWWTGRTPRFFWAALSATVGAQLAVVPLLVVHFGTVPLFSPIANLLVAPLVTVATALAGVGVIVNWDVPLVLAEQVAGWILRIARVAGEWPQLDPVGVVGVGALAIVGWRTRTAPLLVAGAILVAILGAVPPGPPEIPTVTFLDVGQGDAVLLQDPSGANALIDGGSDPAVLRRALRRYGVGRIDLLVASHGDADHVGGLRGIEQSIAVERFWLPAGQPVSDLLGELVDQLEVSGVMVEEVGDGLGARLGGLRIDVIGPRRRYAEENDGSVVLLVEANGLTVLLPGDVGRTAQAELPAFLPDVLLVPHHGAGTTDLDWLDETVGRLAVISVGPNTYGHPTPEVISVLEGAGTEIRTTAAEGDVSVPLVGVPPGQKVADATLVGP